MCRVGCPSYCSEWLEKPSSSLKNRRGPPIIQMAEDAQLRPPSPCTNVCVLDEAGRCTGCLRDLTEIASWGSMTSAEQWQLLAVLKERRKKRAKLHESGSIEQAPPR